MTVSIMCNVCNIWSGLQWDARQPVYELIEKNTLLAKCGTFVEMQLIRVIL